MFSYNENIWEIKNSKEKKLIDNKYITFNNKKIIEIVWYDSLSLLIYSLTEKTYYLFIEGKIFQKKKWFFWNIFWKIKNSKDDIITNYKLHIDKWIKFNFKNNKLQKFEVYELIYKKI